jgi:hypothetical protein
VWHWRRIRCGGLKCARAVFERDAAIPSSGASVRLDAVTVTELLRLAPFSLGTITIVLAAGG